MEAQSYTMVTGEVPLFSNLQQHLAIADVTADFNNKNSV